MDFIRTIENRYYNKNMEEMNQFFFDNLNVVEDLVKQYEAFKNDLYRRQCDEIAEIKKQLVEKTGANWWIYQGWDLGITFNNDINDRRIGIESNFETDFGEHNPLGIFKIFITVWDNKCFEPFRDELIKTFPEAEIDKSPINGRIYMHLPIIYNGNISEIVNKMENYYSILKGIVVSDI